MPQPKPFHRIARNVLPGPNSGYNGIAYIRDPEYAVDPLHFVRSFLLIQEDLKRLFEYIEPSDTCSCTYSFRIHELLVRTCIEVEANLKAILLENGYKGGGNLGRDSRLDMSTYKKVNVSHHLSSYRVSLPIWRGNGSVVVPFESWAENKALPWYQSYNASKHDRHNSFKRANFRSLIDAVSGLLVILASQFRDEDFSCGPNLISIGPPARADGMRPALGSLFMISYPEDWSIDEIYEFDWIELSKQSDRFAKFDYDAI